MRLRFVSSWMLTVVFFGITALTGQASVVEEEAPSAPVSGNVQFFVGPGEFAVLVDKERQELSVFEYRDTPVEIFKTACSTGKSPGPKHAEGDAKTPEGIYFFVERHEDAQLAPIYGVGAFSTDYPNLADRMAGKTGSAIWLHGTNKPLVPRDSNGCIVLENSDFERVAPYITLNRTPVIIADRLTPDAFDITAEDRNRLLETARNWGKALAAGTYHDYLNYYDAGYLPEITWWPRWRTIRGTLGTESRPLSAEPEKTAIFRNGDQYILFFDLFLNQGGRRISVGTKKLFLTQKSDGFRITGEYFQGMPAAGGGPEMHHPVLAASRRLEVLPAPVPVAAAEPASSPEPPPVATGEIEEMVDAWLDAWTRKDIQHYGHYYASDFRSQGMNKQSWLSYKDRLNRKYDYIRVSRRDGVNARPGQDGLRVSFVQRYESNAFKAVGLKLLHLKREQGQWKIYRESWKRL